MQNLHGSGGVGRHMENRFSIHFYSLDGPKLRSPTIILDGQKLQSPTIILDGQKLRSPTIILDGPKLRSTTVILDAPKLQLKNTKYTMLTLSSFIHKN